MGSVGRREAWISQRTDAATVLLDFLLNNGFEVASVKLSREKCSNARTHQQQTKRDGRICIFHGALQELTHTRSKGTGTYLLVCDFYENETKLS